MAVFSMHYLVQGTLQRRKFIAIFLSLFLCFALRAHVCCKQQGVAGDIPHP